MKKIQIIQGKLSLAVVGLALILFSACGPSRPVLNVYNWSDYMDMEAVEAFEELFEVDVVFDYFDSNDTMYAKLQAGASGYDIAFPTSYMVELMFQENLIQEMDQSRIPNLVHIDRNLLNFSEDPEMRYSIPYMISNTGVGYLQSRLGDDFDRSWNIFADTRFAGRMTMLNDQREAIGAALKYLGYSANSTSIAELEAARDQLIAWKRNLAKFEADQYKNGLVSGEFIVAQGYNGDIAQVMAENEDIGYFLPREGVIFSMDQMVILRESTQVDLAYAFINYMLEPEVAASNIEYVYFLAPNTGAYPLLSQEILDDPSIFPPQEILERSEIIRDQGEFNAQYSRIWDEVRSAR